MIERMDSRFPSSLSTGDRMLRVLALEDERFYQETIRRSVSLVASSVKTTLLSTVGDAKENIRSVRDPYDLAIIDLGLPDGDGLDVVRCLSRKSPETIITVLSVTTDEKSVLRSFRAGASGFIVKGDAFLSLPKAIEQALSGFHPVSPSIFGYFLRIVGRDSNESEEEASPVLTLRELELLREFSAGKSYKQAADSMGISVFTVRTHTNNIYRKMGVKSNLAALSLARKHGLV